MTLIKKKLPKCKECKSEFMPFNNNSLQKYCMQKDECIAAFAAYSKEVNEKTKVKQWNKEKAVLKIDTHVKENKSELQKQINKLSKLIDAKFNYTTCICCHRGFGKQTDAAHFHSIGSNSSLRFNLDNIHSASSYCNDYSNTHIVGYKIGLEQRYGKEYAGYVIDELRVKYKEVHLTNQDIADKLKLVRSIVRNFDTYKFENSLQARKQLNELINIYK